MIDLRHNNGGDNTTYGPLLDLLSTHQRITEPGFLYAIIGRQTFSAAMNFAADLDRFTTAVFVGEGTGGSPFHYGDSQPVVLPNSGIQVNISSRIHNSPFADDDRLAILPDLPVELDSTQFFADIDPALDAILSAD